jgi:drug/metabolite transporter (DMT)-like permease
METLMVHYALPFSLIACLIAAVLAIGFPILKVIKDKDPSVLKQIGIFAGAAILLYLIGYLFAGEADQEYLDLRKISPTVYTNVSVGITVMVVMTLAAFGLIIYSEVKNFIK